MRTKVEILTDLSNQWKSGGGQAEGLYTRQFNDLFKELKQVYPDLLLIIWRKLAPQNQETSELYLHGQIEFDYILTQMIRDEKLQQLGI